MISMTIRIVYCNNQIFEIFLFTLGSFIQNGIAFVAAVTDCHPVRKPDRAFPAAGFSYKCFSLDKY